MSRGGRMLEEEAYVSLWNLLESIPTLSDPSVSVKEESWQFNPYWVRLVVRTRRVERVHADGAAGPG